MTPLYKPLTLRQKVNHMKKYVLLCIVLLFGFACSSDSPSNSSNYTELEVADSHVTSSKRLTGEIGEAGEVDLYRVHLTQTNRNVQIKCTQKLDDDVDISGDQQELTLLLQIYEEDADGNFVMVAGEQAVEGSPLPADMKQSVYVDRVKDLFIHVRDLMDDDGSQRPYYISATYETPPDGNDSLGSSETVTLAVDGNGAVDEIGAVGDVDYFKFDIGTAGVYDISVAYDEFLGSGMELSMTLTSQPDGTAVDERSIENTGTVHMIHYLEAGSYAVALDDEGRDDFSPTSMYTINVETASVAEVMENDTPSSVEGEAMPETVIGSLGYFEDQDWYPVVQAAGGDLSVLEMTFTPTDSLTYKVSVYELNDPAAFDSSVDTPLFVRNIIPSLHGALQATIKLDRSLDYFIMVTAASGSDIDEGKAYTLALETANIDDNWDETGDPDGDGHDSNDDSSEATALPQTTGSQGKIAYRGDKDWYTFTTPNEDSQVLTVYLDVPGSLEAPPEVQYGFEIYENLVSEPLKRVVPSVASRRAVDLKTGIRIDADTTYFIKVYDVQNNDSDDAFYTLTWDVGVAETPVTDPDGGTPDYYAETAEDGNADHQITILKPTEINEYDRDTYNVKTDALRLSGEANGGLGDDMTFTEGVGYRQYRSKWLTGYVDYQGDEDWFGMDLTAPPGDVALAEGTSWYYTIDLELYSDESPVEFILEYLPDSDGDQAMNSRECDEFDPDPDNRVIFCNGKQSSLFDDTPDVLDAPMTKSITSANIVNTVDTSLWIGSGDPNPWEGLVYFRVRDFYHIYLDENRTVLNPDPDDDWSVTNPYYFRVTLKFYSGSSRPYCPTIDD